MRSKNIWAKWLFSLQRLLYFDSEGASKTRPQHIANHYSQVKNTLTDNIYQLVDKNT